MLTIFVTGMSIFISDVGLITMMYLLYLFGHAYGWKAFVGYYFIPYVVSARVSTFMIGAHVRLPKLCNHWYGIQL